MSQVDTLCKLVALEPIEPLHAQFVCGWPADQFAAALAMALSQRLIRVARGVNQHTTRLEAA